MEKNITIINHTLVLNTIANLIVARLTSYVEVLRKYYSNVLERDIDMRQTWLLVNAQLAFVFAAFPVSGPILLRTACCLWFLHAVLLCKRNL